MDQLLEVKIGCLAGLLVVTLICGLIPAQVRWFQSNMARGKHRRILSFIGCFAAGVFLGACIMHMVADALGDIQEELKKRRQQGASMHKQNGTSEGDDDSEMYPFGELVISAGFFLVFLIESVVLHCCPRAVHSHGDHNTEEDHKDPPESHSSFRAFVLFLSLSFHSVFEGLAIGVQKQETAAIQLCLAVLIHKAIVVFSLALKLVQSGTPARWRLLYLVVFALMSPAGIGVGIGVSLYNSDGTSLAQALLEGVAAGTFLYVTFLEILPYELRSHESPLTKFFFIGLGFSIMAIIAIWA
ncbi:zinc transporter ZIP2 [Podarcis raffonei]|uniref:Solute carrier family 39 member 2 n=1 Tax=Podarcis muralis TaxID=64176 RepID=A0A670JJK5_PODMU|nr:zinc transporter ZIP2 [Podarcis muralis]XP_053218431.1 zinc transporter ZIP2 [Podarcis raffonei]